MTYITKLGSQMTRRIARELKNKSPNNYDVQALGKVHTKFSEG